MRIKRVNETLDRLKNILTYKETNYQKRLDTFDKKRELENILCKYPNDPIRGLVELNIDELNILLSYFTSEKYDSEDLNLKQYWMLEASTNEALMDTNRYKKANKLFVTLADKLQEYLESLEGFNINEEDTQDYLDLIMQLNSRLKSDDVIEDLSIFYPVLLTNETIVQDDVYNFLIAIAVNNLRIITTDKYVTPKVKVSKEMKDYLKKILEERIRELETERDKYVVINQKLVKLNKLINTIKNNYDAIIDVYPTTIEEVMTDLWSEDFIDDELNRLMIPITVIKGKKQGISIDFNEEEAHVIERFISILEEEEKTISDKEVSDKKERSEKLSKKIDSLRVTLDKIDGKSKYFFEEDDFYNLVQLLKDKDQQVEYIKNIITTLNALNLKLATKMNEPEEEIKEENNSDIALEAVKTLSFEDIAPNIEDNNTSNNYEELFSKYGYDISKLPSKLFETMNRYTTISHIKEMLEFIDQNDSLSFLKNISYEETPIGKKIQDIKYSQLYYMLVYSNTQTLEKLINIAKDNNLNLEDIFAVPKVFVSVNEEGTYEYFLENFKFIKNEYPDILKKIIKVAPSVLGTDSELFRRNIEATETYGMSIESDKKGAFPSPRALASVDFEFVMDRYIEAHEYDYVERFRNQLETNYMVALRLKYLQLKGIDLRQSGFVNIDAQFPREIKYYLKDLSMENMPVAISDSNIKWLDSINEENSSEKQKAQYILGGVCISRPKVLKYYSTFLINKYEDLNLALFYSVVKDSYLTLEEFNTLKKIVYDREER